MKKKLLWLLLVLQVIFFLPWGLGQAAGIPPKPARDIYVVDEAGVLSSRTKQIILAYSSALAKRTKTQVVVLTVPTLDGESIEDYGLSVLREWGIGDKKENNGVLLLVATKDRKSRIEVGYGLEGVLPDGLTGRIQDQYMLPSFRKGNYDEGIPERLFRRPPDRGERLWPECQGPSRRRNEPAPAPGTIGRSAFFDAAYPFWGYCAALFGGPPALWRCHLPNLALPFLLSRRWPRRWLWRGRRLRWRQFWRRLRWGRRFQS